MKNYFYKIAVALLAILVLSCTDTKKSKYTNQVDVSTTTLNEHPGKTLMENKCYVCHNPTTNHKGRVAPPMVAVKSHYLDDDTTKKEFSDAIWEFVKKPNPYKTKMRGAVNRFGLMPYQEFKEEDIRQIADYIYDTKIDEPEWFKEHIEEESEGKINYRNEGKKEVSSSSSKEDIPEKVGLKYALNTKKELGRNLMGTIQKKGTLEAVAFCNKRAYPITDSMALAQNAKIKRVSDKPRNPENQANPKELTFIKNFKQLIASNQEYEPITEIVNNEVSFYYPIITNSMCLQCHGVPNNDIEPEVLASLIHLYPNDKAIGYGSNEVRGIWSITYKQ